MRSFFLGILPDLDKEQIAIGSPHIQIWICVSNIVTAASMCIENYLKLLRCIIE